VLPVIVSVPVIVIILQSYAKHFEGIRGTYSVKELMKWPLLDLPHLP
jgi:hypothetical protein